MVDWMIHGQVGLCKLLGLTATLLIKSGGAADLLTGVKYDMEML